MKPNQKESKQTRKEQSEQVEIIPNPPLKSCLKQIKPANQTVVQSQEVTSNVNLPTEQKSDRQTRQMMKKSDLSTSNLNSSLVRRSLSHAPQYPPGDKNIAKSRDLEPVFKNIGLPDLPLPVIRGSVFYDNHVPYTPFYNTFRQKFEQPFALSSKAPFASNRSYSFITTENQTVQRLPYHKHQEQLQTTIMQQAERLYDQELIRRFYKERLAIQGFAPEMRQKFTMLGCMFEVMQAACPTHLKWTFETVSGDKDKAKAKKKIKTRTSAIEESQNPKEEWKDPDAEPQSIRISVVNTPVLNPSFRNVLDEEDECSKLLTAEEHDSALEILKIKNELKGSKRLVCKMFETGQIFNKLVPVYGEGCIKELLSIREKADSYQERNELFCKITEQYSDQLREKGIKPPKLKKERSFEDESKCVNEDDYDKQDSQKNNTLCVLPTRKAGMLEPTTSFNSFIPFKTPRDLVIKGTTSAQLVFQQMMRNPLGFHRNPGRIVRQFYGPHQTDIKFFIGNTVFMTGSYSDQASRQEQAHPKLKNITGKVTLQCLASLTEAQAEAYWHKQNKKHFSPLKDVKIEDRRRQCYLGYTKLLRKAIRTYVDQLQANQLHNKAEFLYRCRIIVSTTFSLDNEQMSFNTNCRYVSGQELLFRIPKSKPLFKNEHFEKARSVNEEPILLDLLPHLTQAEGEAFLQNCDFDTLENHVAREKKVHGFQFKEEEQTNQPWFQMLLLFMHVCAKNGCTFKDARRFKFKDTSLYILAQENIGLPQLIEEHSLCNAGGSDFACHSGITNPRLEKLIQYQFKACFLSGDIKMNKDQVLCQRSFTQAQHDSILSWLDSIDKVLQFGPKEVLKQFEKLTFKQRDQLINFTKRVIDLIAAHPTKRAMSNALLTVAYSEIGEIDEQERNVAVDTLNYYSKILGKRFREQENYLMSLVSLYQSQKKLPYYIMARNFAPNQNHYGLVPTKHMICVPNQEFRMLFNIVGRKNVKRSKLILDQEGCLEKDQSIQLHKLFFTSIYRLLIHYLTLYGRALLHQLRAIIENGDTLVNFAHLIQCVWYWDSRRRPILSKLEMDQCLDLAFEESQHFVSEDIDIHEYKTKVEDTLCEELKRMGVEYKKWPSHLKKLHLRRSRSKRNRNPALQTQQPEISRKRELKAAKKSMEMAWTPTSEPVVAPYFEQDVGPEKMQKLYESCQDAKTHLQADFAKNPDFGFKPNEDDSLGAIIDGGRQPIQGSSDSSRENESE